MAKVFDPRQAVAARGGKKLTKKVGTGKSHLESLMAQQIRMAGLPIPEEEYHFAAEHVGREKGVKKRLAEAELKNWRFDFAWPGVSWKSGEPIEIRLAVEVEGGIWLGQTVDPKTGKPRKGRHNTGKGMEADIEKYNAALLLGWHILRFTSGHIKSGYAIRTIKKYFQENNEN